MNKPINCGCGGEAKVYVYSMDGGFWHRYNVECTKCNVKTPKYDTKVEAIEAWNKAMDVKDINISDKATVIIEPFTTDMDHVGYCMCGYLVNAEWEYCPSCGARLEWSDWK